jgi:hypothetical protein
MTRAWFKWLFVVAGAFALAAVAVSGIVWLAEIFLKSSGKHPTSAEQLDHWIRIVAGKWSLDQIVYGRTSFLYALSAGLVLLLNLVVIAALASLIIGWVSKVRPLLLILGMEKLMNFEQLSNSQLARVKLEIYNRLFAPEQHTEETRKKIDDVVDIAKEAWRQEIDKHFAEQAPRLWRRMKKSFD